MGRFSVLQVVFLLQRHTGYFLIQVKLEECGLQGDRKFAANGNVSG